MSTRFSNEEGFGMVEVLVAMLLLGVAAIMALPMLHMSLENSRLTTNAAEASQLMNSEISHVSSREHTCQGLAQWAAALSGEPTHHISRCGAGRRAADRSVQHSRHREGHRPGDRRRARLRRRQHRRADR
ncbi:prepilin-type N-terminal cleavage/methylation domain-containing protein [Nesterenkonia pannonica]|uniref:type II secretion system protein n=1 Tax=Nesterenkonia pannonica TaxID=1548602 RepID=UPI00216490EF|nr:prepilin-type N-terminal cleavage/methylation domain-containing protein [Nesterenkonia pannonica]